MKKDKENKKECNCNEEVNNCLNNNECNCNDDCSCEDTCCCEDNCCCGDTCSCDSDEKCSEQCNCNDDLELMANRIKQLEDALLRSQAELLNYRKRKDEETARMLKYAEEDVLKGLLPILDNFERAIKMDDNNFGDETSKFLEGFRMVYNQTMNLLEQYDVKEIDCLNKEFDPTYEQAISTEKNDNLEAGFVSKIYQKGYTYKDKVLRTAMVIVSE